jgi:DNA-binding CsgD family transcriptional regulator
MAIVLDEARTALLTGQQESLARLQLSPSPTLIFEVDAGGMGDESAPARRGDVRLVGSMRNRSRGQGQDGSAESAVSAVLIIRALTPTRLLAVVRAITRGGATVPPEMLSELMPRAEQDAPGFHPEELTPRELSVLKMLADGLATREIAEELSYSERTVKNIVREVLDKLSCRTRAHAVALAVRHGVI